MQLHLYRKALNVLNYNKFRENFKKLILQCSQNLKVQSKNYKLSHKITKLI